MSQECLVTTQMQKLKSTNQHNEIAVQSQYCTTESKLRGMKCIKAIFVFLISTNGHHISCSVRKFCHCIQGACMLLFCLQKQKNVLPDQVEYLVVELDLWHCQCSFFCTLTQRKQNMTFLFFCYHLFRLSSEKKQS